MRVALVHELLTMRGGAERVLRILADMFPHAPIFTLLYDERKLGDWFPRERVHPSTLQRYAQISTNHHFYLPFFPSAVEAWDFSEYDLVISTSSAFAHGIITNRKPLHLCYVHSPARYLWDRAHDVQRNARTGFFGPLKSAYLSHVCHSLRVWDTEAAGRADVLLAASHEVQRRIELYWRRESTVLYPPIAQEWLSQKGKKPMKSSDESQYLLLVSTLSRYKRIDLAIEACNALSLTLRIVGEGPDLTRLRSLAGPTIEFLGYTPSSELRDLYAAATATIMPGEEDFGIVPLESMACGTPVIAYGKGGARETIIEGVTGAFFDEPTSASLAQILSTLKSEEYDPIACAERAKAFSEEHFRSGIHATIEAMLSRRDSN